MPPGEAIVAQNRRARRDYEILDRYEAGLALTGSEIKSIRLGKVDIQGAYGRIRNGEAWLLDSYIAPYQNAGYLNHEARRDRKLLLHKKELRRIREALDERGLTLVPLNMHLKRGMAKVELGVARGIKRYDKRRKIREREEGRQVARALRHSV
ncbi:MAG: SsrA-binding protein SmpB [Dehalococcoidia bacterium]|nr:SsrA-binding protein SmpB [Dehalococcoidia bacterium]